MTTTTGPTRLWARLLLAVLAASLVASACSDDSGDTTADAPATTAPATDVADYPEPSDAAPDPGEDNASYADSGAPEPEEADEPDPAASDDEPAPDDADAASDSPDAGVQRIVSISPTGTEMLFAIGAGDRVVAVDQFSYFPEEAPVTDLDGWSPNIEAIASYEPDLVVLQAGGDVIAGIEALGIEVFAHSGPAAIDDVYTQLADLGAVTGQTDEAASLAADMQARIAELVAAAPDASGLTYYHELDDTLYSVTSNTFIGQVYSLFGLANMADPADADGSAFGYPQLSDEYLVDADPDVIFLADTLCCGQSAETVAERPGWDQLTAVQTGRIVELDDDIASRWGPRLVDFIAAISDVLVSIGAAA